MLQTTVDVAKIARIAKVIARTANAPDARSAERRQLAGQQSSMMNITKMTRN